MNATGATGPSPNEGNFAAAAAAKLTGPNGPTKPSAQPGANADQAGDKRGGNSQKPIPIPPTFANFPAELTSLPNWVLWRYLPPKSRGKKWRKVPFQPDGKTAGSTDRSTWSRFEDCRIVYARGGFDGVGFVFDGEIGTDGLCYCGVDFDTCIDGKNVHSLARSRINRLNTYFEVSVSGTGFHCIVRAKPLDGTVKYDGVEIYDKARYFTFTGCSFGEIKAAPAEVAALVDEVRAKEAAAKQQQQSGLSTVTDPFKNAKPSQAFAALARAPDNLAAGMQAFAGLGGAPDNLGAGIKTQWFEILSPQEKDQVVDCALDAIGTNTPLLELEADGGNNAEYYKLTTSVARSGAPNAEDIFVKHASRAKNADTEEALRQHFSRCRASQPSTHREITVGTLLLLAQQNGANFDQWKCPTSSVPVSAPITWSPATLQFSFFNIPHRKWLYGIDLIRGEVTFLAAPGGAGKTALAIGRAIEIATGIEILGEKIYQAHPLKVLFINGEDGGSEIARRIWAFSLAYAQKLAGQNLGRLYVAGTDDARVQRLSFLKTEKNLSTLNQDAFEVLKSALETLQPDLLVLDPLVAFCGSGDMNSSAVVAPVIRELKRLATESNCAVLIIHHTRKGGEKDNAEAISGSAAMVNLARRALMVVPMTESEATKFGVLPSERWRYFKLVDAKSNFAPRSADSPWYLLHSVDLPNAEPPVYLFGDSVQAVQRVNLSALQAASPTADDQKIQDAIFDLIERGKMFGGQSYPYSPSLAGATNKRAVLDDAMKAVATATVPQQWQPDDLRAVIQRTIKQMKKDGGLFEEQITEGRFRNRQALRANRPRISRPDTDSEGTAPSGDPTVSQEEKGLDKDSAKPAQPSKMSAADRAAARAAKAERKAKGK